ncbi:MAG TPA: SAM-dependent methyltransferase [Kineosporiaceae bacterium]
MSGHDDRSSIDSEVADWVPPPVDASTPSVARIYDYWLGGKDNFAIDREVADRIARTDGGGPEGAHANRRFLVEAVRSMAQAGVRQFIDLGAGIPTSPSVHETAWAIHPDARVVYVDTDPVVLAHTRALLSSEPRTAVLPGDLRDPAAILADPSVRALVDLTQPVGLLMIAVLHFVDTAAAPRIVARYLRDLAPGSQLAICSASSEGGDPEALARTRAAYTAATLIFRTRIEIEALFDHLDMVRPVTAVHRFASGSSLGGIGVKSATRSSSAGIEGAELG